MKTEQSTSETKADAAKGEQAVTISAPPQQVTIDPQNPLPEPSFLWRRVLTMVVSTALLGIAWHNAIQLHDLGVSKHLLTFAQWCIALNGFVLLCYFVGPSATEIINMVQSARIIKSSLVMASNADDNATQRTEKREDRQFDRSEREATEKHEIALSEPGNVPEPDYGIKDDEDFAPTGRK